MSALGHDPLGPPPDLSEHEAAEAFDLQLDTRLHQAALGAQTTRVVPSLLDFLR